jgi:hypothetical protein
MLYKGIGPGSPPPSRRMHDAADRWFLKLPSSIGGKRRLRVCRMLERGTTGK